MGNRASVYGIGFKRIFKSSNSIIFLIVVVLCLLIGRKRANSDAATGRVPLWHGGAFRAGQKCGDGVGAQQDTTL